MKLTFPMDSGKKCPQCGGPVIYHYKRDYDRDQIYCSLECWNKSHQKYPKIITDRVCPICGKKFRHHKKIYCSRECSKKYALSCINQPVSKYVDLVCQNCGKPFRVKERYKNYKYCSNDCRLKVRNEKYTINEKYFEEFNDDNCYTLGQLWSNTLLISYNELQIYGNEDQISVILKRLSSDYPIHKAYSTNFFKKTHRCTIQNLKFISNLLDTGIHEHPLYREWPCIPDKYKLNFFKGYLSMCNVKEDENRTWIQMISKPMAYESSNLYNMKSIYADGDWWCVEEK